MTIMCFFASAEVLPGSFISAAFANTAVSAVLRLLLFATLGKCKRTKFVWQDFRVLFACVYILVSTWH